jgi:signal transduction histidine kinase/HAMP domain-containing protein
MPFRETAPLASRRLRAVAMTIRGKILLAFCAIAAITGFLGLSAVNSVIESGRLVVETYDKPLMAISYARLALSNFRAEQLALVIRLDAKAPDKVAELDAEMAQLGRAIDEDLTVAEQRSMSTTAAAAARDSRHAIELWTNLRQRLFGDPAQRPPLAALEDCASHVVEALDNLVELTAEDGFRGRERALASIATYRALSIGCTIAALLLGAVIASLLARRMVQPIAAASRAASRIAEGELDVDIIQAGGDELGQLLEAMSRMRDKIRGMMDREIAARRSAQTRLINALECSAEGVILVDGDGSILLANSQVAAFFPELSRSLVAGCHLPGPLDLALTQPTAELRLVDGRWLRLGSSSTSDGGFVVIGTDITLLKEREAALQLAKDQAEAANRAKSEFLANMSHELRTPLNAVIGFSEIIAAEMFGPVGQVRYKDFAGDIVRSGRHLLEVISDILDVAKLQSGKTELHLKRLELREVIDEAMRIVQEQAGSSGVVLKSDVDPELPMVDGDATRLRQVLLNLLSNAIKFTPAGGEIVVAARCVGDRVSLIVRDSGIGMAAKDIPKAFEPFGQIDSSLARKYGGTGLGLPLSKMFAELHGGGLAIESAPGVGTIVTVTLPAAPHERHALKAAC